MRLWIRHTATVVLTVATAACADRGALDPAPNAQLHAAAVTVAVSALPAVRISEIHYDNVGTDAGEAIEISGPAGTDLTGWQVVLYNGNGGAAYNTRTLSGTIPATCDARGVVVLTYPVDGIQNGSPDGIALVDATGAIVEFLSYEGSFAATGGPAAALTSTDILVSESTTTTADQSLQRDGSGVWSAPAANTFGACNDGDAAPPPPPPPEPGLPPVRFSEIHYDNVGTDTGESIEIEGPTGTDLTGWSVVLYNGNGGVAYGTRSLTGTIPATCDGRGVLVLSYPQDGIQNGSPDGFALVDAGGKVVEFLSYEGTFTAADGPAAGTASVDIGVSESSSPLGQSLQRTTAGAWQPPAAASFGACNGGGPTTPPGNTITFTGRTAGDPPLPVGFQDQLFATVRDASGATVTTTITWSSETPSLASIDQNGVMTALGAGTAIVRATTADGVTTATFSLPTRVAAASTTAQYEGNAEFGEPTDADPSDDFVVRYAQYTASYSTTRGTPNWVSYNLEATHFGTEDRCDCFTFDPALPESFTRYTTADYTGAGAFHGYGIDRGHLARSFDRTSASLDNAFTFYFTNIIPQAADLNQGPWAELENYLGDLARLQNREVYIITGVAGSKGTVKDEGKITIPASVWKVAVIMPRDAGLEHIDDAGDVEVVAVIMPNEPGVRNVDWRGYEATVDEIEALSGYDLLALLPDPIERVIERGVNPPTASTDGPYSALEGSLVTMSAAASIDPAGGGLTYAWSFGDGATGTGATVAHTYAQDGAYSVRLVVTDATGTADTTATTAVVANVAPVIGALGGATLLVGETFVTAGPFVDPGADPWSAAVDYGDGSGTTTLALAGKSFTLSHTYATPGTFTLTVRVDDDDVTSTRTATITVLSPAQGVGQAIARIVQLAAVGRVSRGNVNALQAKLEAAAKALERGNTGAAAGTLQAFLHQLDALIRSGRLTAADAESLRTLVERIIAATTA